jgi:general L-amino acid transport system permease protein
MLTVFPVSTAILLGGGVLGLNPVSTSRWGGLTLTLVVATWGIVTSIPAGMALALGRQSSMPIIKHACAIYIEFWRGIPLLGVLFMAATMFPLFMPAGVEFDKLLRALIAFTLFNSAYMAEVFRGGLQAIGRGQYEASTALSLPYWTAVRRIIMPQALRIAIPSLVNTCITIFKQSSIFLTIGLYEFLGMIQAGTADPEWVRVSEVLQTGYVFAAIVYWAFCFSMSRYSRYIERSQGTTHH